MTHTWWVRDVGSFTGPLLEVVLPAGEHDVMLLAPELHLVVGIAPELGGELEEALAGASVAVLAISPIGSWSA